MLWIGLSVSAAYVLGFIGTFYIHVETESPVTFGLVLLRSFVWPVFWATGWPQGEPLRMD